MTPRVLLTAPGVLAFAAGLYANNVSPEETASLHVELLGVSATCSPTADTVAYLKNVPSEEFSAGAKHWTPLAAANRNALNQTLATKRHHPA